MPNRRSLFRLTLLAFSCLFFAMPSFAQERRVALVIGNSDYTALPELRNPENDAQTLSATLANLGFTVYLANNLKQSELIAAFATYSLKAKNADVSLIYYAGHSAALDDQNLIFSTDFDPNNSGEIPYLITLSDITDLMANGVGTQLIFFDACQEPMTIKTSGGNIKLRAITPKVPPVGTLISYASASGFAAHDGLGNHSLFTGALLDNLSMPDIDIEQTLRHVRRDVIRNSQGAQIPQTSSSLVSAFFLYPTETTNTSTSLQNALLQNGFSQKPILSDIASGITTPKKTQGLTGKQALLRDSLCEKIAPPRPKICQP